MEPVTHFLTGACLGRAGLNRKAAYATLAMTIAAEFPDIDTLWSVRGPVAAFEHHRGITHTFLGLPFEAAIVLGLVWVWHRWRGGRAKQPLAPVRWGALYGCCLVALLSHLLLDWTNNYGIRPFFPFNPHWYAGSIVFIFEPVLFAALMLGLLAPWFLGLIGSEVGERRPRFRGQGWAVFALFVMAALWGWRWVERSDALMLVGREDLGGPQLRAFASPYPLNPYKWAAVVELPDRYQIATVDSSTGMVTTAGTTDVYYKPPTTLATLVAKRCWLGEVYLDWSTIPLVEQIDVDREGTATVSFRDLRFLYPTFLTNLDSEGTMWRDHPPLSGTVKVNADRKVVEMTMDGRVQR